MTIPIFALVLTLFVSSILGSCCDFYRVQDVTFSYQQIHKNVTPYVYFGFSKDHCPFSPRQFSCQKSKQLNPYKTEVLLHPIQGMYMVPCLLVGISIIILIIIVIQDNLLCVFYMLDFLKYMHHNKTVFVWILFNKIISKWCYFWYLKSRQFLLACSKPKFLIMITYSLHNVTQ